MATPVNSNGGPYSDPRVNGLLQGSSWSFGNGPRTITYSFTSAFDLEGATAPAWDSRWTNAVTAAFNVWASLANIQFSRVEGIGTVPQNQSTADIAISLEPGNFGLAGLGVFPSPPYANQLLSALGYSRTEGAFPYPRIEGDIAYFPQATSTAAVFNVNGTLDKLQPGGIGFTILLHEIGHALGLKHSFDDGGNGRPTFGDLGLPGGFQYTLMGNELYGADANSRLFPATPMLYDILAIQRIYGANNSFNTGNNTYQLLNDTVYRVIWDAGGNDTLSASNQSIDMTIDLNAGSFSGRTFDTQRVGIAFNVSIENATGGSGNDTITGNELANVLNGGGGNDTLQAGAGDDTLHGGTGNNTLDGGDGNDTYVLSAGSSNTITEGAGPASGIDTVLAPLTFTLPANVENLTLTGTDNINGTGNSLDNVLTGNNGVNTLTGGLGNDRYVVQSLDDVIVEQPGQGTDTILAAFDYVLTAANVENLTLTGAAHLQGTGNALANVITGNAGNNVLDGAGDADTMLGGVGDDTYRVDDPGDSVIEAASEGVDAIEVSFGYTLPANVENLTLTGTDDVDGTGNELNNVLTGNAGMNILTGGLGNDTYVVQDENDVVVEQPNEGIDTIAAPFSITMLPANVENAKLAGILDLALTGNAQNNVLTGNAGNNALTGGGGNDTLIGGAGLDTAVFTGSRSGYTVSRAGGTVAVSSAGEGMDALNGIERLQFADITLALDANPALSGRSDFNDDSSGDVIWRNADGTLALWLMNGSAFGSEVQPLPGIGPGWTVLGTTDFNGDGKTDIALRHADGRLFFWLMNGATIIESGAVISGGVVNTAPIHPAWRVVGASDFNGDGKGDVLFRHENGQVSVWLMDGRNRLSIGLQEANLSPLSKTLVGTGDFNGDGKGDILWRDEQGNVSLWRMNGTALVEALDVTGGELAGGTDWEVVGTGDANGDGRADVVWRKPADGSLALWRMEGAVVTLAGAYAAPGDWTGGDLVDWQVVEVNDYDGDGRHDLLLRKEDGTSAIWRLDGTTVTGSSIIEGAPAKGAGWAVAGQPLAADATTGDALPNWLVGDDGADTLRGLAGDDRLEGRGGDDTLIGGPGNDVLIGGAGNDTALFGSLRSQSTITLSGGVTTVVSSEGTDTLTEIETLVFADDVPEVQVSGNNQNIGDGDASPAGADGTDFGSVFTGAAVERTFTVANTGGVALTTANLVLPAGYTLVEGLTASIAAGASDTFAVRLETDTPGVYGGSITFETNDANENPFEFAITGTVVVPPATLLSIAAADAAKAEGSSGGATAFTFTVTRSGDTSGATTVDWAVTGGASPAASAADFAGGALPAGTVTFAADDLQKTITVSVAQDFAYEAAGVAENFVVTLANASGDTGITQAQAVGAIQNDDALPPPASLSGIADFNDDGAGDVIWRNADGTLALWLMNGSAFGSEVQPLPGIGPGWTVLGTTDFNGDGKTDIALRHADGRLFFWLMNGATIIESGAVISGGVVNTAPIHPAWRVVGASDFNGDGKGDVLFRHENGQVSVWLMDGRNRLSIGLQEANLSPLSKTLVGTGDFNGDGKGDILWRDDEGIVTTWLMDGINRIGERTFLPVPEGGGAIVTAGGPGAAAEAGLVFKGNTAWTVVGVGDLDNNGRSDIVWRNETDGTLGVWIVGQDHVLAETTLTAPAGWPGGSAGAWQVADVNDYDGDGAHDLLLRGDDGTNAIWVMSGHAATGWTMLPGAPAKSVAAWAVAGQPLAADATTGDALPNWLLGDNGADTLRGFAGDDRLEGRDGDDTLIGGPGNDFLIGGAGNDTAVFESLRLQSTVTVSGGVTTVVSSDGTDTLSGIENLVFADDLPEVAVAGLGQNIADGDASPAAADGTDFGAAYQGVPGIERVFTVTNTGLVALTTANLSLPTGFSLWEGLSASIGPGGSDSFTVILDTDTPGVYGGSITFETNDNDENPFDFVIGGVVVVAPPTLLTLATTDSVKTEGDAGATTNFTFTVIRSGDTSGETTVDWAVSAGTSPSADAADFSGGTLPSGTVSFSASELQKTITIAVAGDFSYESNGAAETFTVTLANPSGDSGIAAAAAVGYIYNDDVAPPPASLSGIADFNDDGSGDVIWRNADGTLALWLMNGSAFGSEVQPLPGIGPGWTVLGTTDFNGDGKTDIALRHADGRLFFWLMNGATIIESGAVISGGVVNTAPIHPAWRVVGASDFNGDGKGDVLFRHENGQVSVWLMDGRNRLSIGLQEANLSPLSKTLVGTGDFNGDGKGDILWRDEQGNVSLWYMNGTTMAPPLDVSGPQFSGDTDWVVAGTGDANGDNRADVYWRNELDGRLGVWLMNGTIVSASGELAAPGDWTGGDLVNWQVADVNDYDGDGLHDLLLRNADGTNAIWKLDGLTAESSTLLGGPAKGLQWAVAGQPLAADVTTGDALPNWLIGDDGADTLRGFAGDDRLEGRGGADTFLGGDGNDVLVVENDAFVLADGGAGTDMFKFGGTNLALDFTAIANDKTAGIEAIDLTGAGNNTARLNAADVLDFSNTSNTLAIVGDAGDTVQLAGGGWSAGAVAGGLRTWTSGQATLLVDTDIAVTVI